MKAYVVYDSYFGNTEKVAQAVAGALGSKADVNTARVGDIKPEDLAGLDILIVGSPTRGFRPTQAISNMIDRIPSKGLIGTKVAAFDTRIAVEDVKNGFLTIMVKIFGYAAKPIADKLKKKGGDLVIPPEGFFVTGTEGPLREGELERAAKWAEAMTGKGQHKKKA